MDKNDKRFLLYSSDNEKSKSVLNKFQDLCVNRGFDIVRDNPDFVVSIGGDGTMLRSIRDYKDLSVPFIGINAGSLGFLPTFKSDDDSLNELLELIIKSDYHILMRPLLEVEIKNTRGKVKKDFAFNEVFTKYANTKMMEMDIYIDNEHFNSYTGDGIVVSTPLGATGYAIWSGASILKPSMPCYQLTPINPNNSSIRNPLLYSMIISETEELKFEIKNHETNVVAVSCDGNVLLDRHIESINIRIAKERIGIIESKDYDYWKIFKHKILNKA